MKIVYSTLKRVSIHTLAWRVTQTSPIPQDEKGVSIHTLAWRVTGMVATDNEPTAVSIHTLAWRVTPRSDLSF